MSSIYPVYVDADIENLLTSKLQADVLNANFYAMYLNTGFAETIWSRPTSSEYARFLGYPAAP
jgi:hypothetical protein